MSHAGAIKSARGGERSGSSPQVHNAIKPRHDENVPPHNESAGRHNEFHLPHFENELGHNHGGDFGYAGDDDPYA